jgi:hypothetical protein
MTSPRGLPEPIPDPADAITLAENTLRELIESTLAVTADWLDASGLTPDRVQRMRDRLSEERVRRPGVVIDARILYYADLSDLETIIGRNWQAFKACLGEKKAFDVYLDRLVVFRNAQMHGRELVPFERQLAAGISGEFRNRVTIFRGSTASGDEYFARIEYVQDSFGNVRHGHGSIHEDARTGVVLHPGDTVNFVCHGWDPEDSPLSWEVSMAANVRSDEFVGDSWAWVVSNEEIGEARSVQFYLKSGRRYHRHGRYDDLVAFAYDVFPQR